MKITRHQWSATSAGKVCAQPAEMLIPGSPGVSPSLHLLAGKALINIPFGNNYFTAGLKVSTAFIILASTTLSLTHRNSGSGRSTVEIHWYSTRKAIPMVDVTHEAWLKMHTSMTSYLSTLPRYQDMQAATTIVFLLAFKSSTGARTRISGRSQVVDVHSCCMLTLA